LYILDFSLMPKTQDILPSVHQSVHIFFDTKLLKLQLDKILERMTLENQWTMRRLEGEFAVGGVKVRSWLKGFQIILIPIWRFRLMRFTRRLIRALHYLLVITFSFIVFIYLKFMLFILTFNTFKLIITLLFIIILITLFFYFLLFIPTLP